MHGYLNAWRRDPWGLAAGTLVAALWLAAMLFLVDTIATKAALRICGLG